MNQPKPMTVSIKSITPERKRRRAWSDDEIKFLKDNINTLADCDIASALNRSECSVIGKKRRCGLRQSYDLYCATRAKKKGPDSPIWKGGLAESQRRRWLNHPDAIKARYTVVRRIKMGYIKRQPCEVCGSTVNIQAHHEDYSKPLSIRWLCKEHHKVLHRYPYLAAREAST